MRIDCLALGEFETNCYILRPTDQEKKCLILDPGYSPQSLLELLQHENLVPQRILLTHGHCDHIAGIPLLREHYPKLPVSIGRLDAGMMIDRMKNLSAMAGMPVQMDKPDNLLETGDIIELESIRLTVLPTPGHTPGGISFYDAAEAIVFTGDALFAGSIGRTDFPGSNGELLLRSIAEQLLVLPGETCIYPGHGPVTTVDREKRTNPFFR